MKYVTPYAELLSLEKQDILTFSFQQEGNASNDILDFEVHTVFGVVALYNVFKESLTASCANAVYKSVTEFFNHYL